MVENQCWGSPVSVGMIQMHSCAKYQMYTYDRFSAVHIWSFTHLSSLMVEICLMLHWLIHPTYVYHILRYEESRSTTVVLRLLHISADTLLWWPWRSTGKVINVIIILWTYNTSLCNVPLTQETKSSLEQIWLPLKAKWCQWPEIMELHTFCIDDKENTLLAIHYCS